MSAAKGTMLHSMFNFPDLEPASNLFGIFWTKAPLWLAEFFLRGLKGGQPAGMNTGTEKTYRQTDA